MNAIYRKISVCMIVVFLGFCTVLSATSQNTSLVEGLQSYAQADWKTATALFKKAVAEEESAESWYWLIMSQMSSGEYKNALRDAELFLRSFSGNKREPEIRYQYGRALYHVQRYEESIAALYHFYNTYSEHELAASALFWIAESLYDLGDIESAETLYTKVIREYSSSTKFEAASYRLALIAQRGREEELLILLKNTHEESLKMKEEYERRERDYEQTIVAYQKRIADLLADTRLSNLEKELGSEKVKSASLLERIKELEAQVVRLTAENNELNALNNNDVKSDLEVLLEKAQKVQDTIDKSGGM